MIGAREAAQGSFLRSLSLGVLAGAMLFGACQPAGRGTEGAATKTTDAAANEDTVRQLAQQWAAAESANDIDGAIALMWEDAVMQPPNAPQIQGHEAIRTLYESVTFESLDAGPLTVHASGDLAVVWSPEMTYTLALPDGTFSDTAKFVAVWERRNGEWKVLENTWNTNLAAPGSGDVEEDSEGTAE